MGPRASTERKEDQREVRGKMTLTVEYFKKKKKVCKMCVCVCVVLLTGVCRSAFLSTVDETLTSLSKARSCRNHS